MLVTISALLCRIFSNPIANTVQKFLSEKYSAVLINVYSYMFLSIFACADSYYSKIDWHVYGFDFWGYVALAGILCTLGSVCLIKALQYGEMSVLGPINSYKCIVGMIIGLFILGEFPNLYGFLGVVLIIWGSWFIFDTTDEGFSFKLLKRKDIILRFLALLFTGFEAVILKKIILMSSVNICFILWCLSGFLFSILLMMLFRIKLCLFSKKDMLFVSVIALCLGLMQYSTNIVFKRLDVGLSLALFQLSSVVSVIFGYKIFKEKDFVQKITGSVIMIIGTCLILLSA